MKWIVRAVAVLVAIAVVLVGLLFLLPTDRIANVALGRLSAGLDREIRLEGDVRPTLWPVLGVRTGRVTVANADWVGAEPMAEIGSLTVGVEMRPLLSGDIRVTELVLSEPVVRLATSPDGAGNWEFSGSGSGSGSGEPTETTEVAPSDSTPAREFSLDGARIEDGTLIFAPAEGTPLRLDDVDADVALTARDAPAELALTATSGGAPVALTLRLDSLDGLLGAGTGVRLTGGAGNARADYAGTLGLSPLAGEGDLDADLSDRGALFAALGLTPPDVSEGLGRDTASVAGHLKIAEGGLMLDGAQIGLDQNRIAGDLALATGGARPKLTGRLNLGAFALPEEDGADGGGDGAAGGESGPDGWSTEPIDTAWMDAIDLALDIAATSMTLGASEIGATDLGLVLDERRLVADIRRLAAYDGALQGKAVLNGRGGLSTALDVSGSALAISRLLAELLDYDRIVAAGDLALAVQGEGPSMDAIMNSLDGNGRFHVGAGELLGFDIVGLLETLDPKVLRAGRSTIFDEIVGTFRIVDGVVTNQDLSIRAPLFAAEGTGTVGLGGQTLDYTISPHLLEGEKADVTIPIRITGTWDDPKFGVDLAAMAKGAAGRELRRRAAEELGVDEGAVEDAAKEKLGEEVKRGLGRLLGR